MREFRDLKLIGSTSEQEKLVDMIDQNLNNGWTRDRENEALIKQIVFTCTKTLSRPVAFLCLCHHKDGYLYVSNIVSTKDVYLGIDSYNAVLDEFLTQFVEPAAIGLDIRIISKSGEKAIDNIMSSKMSQLLRSFSGAANKSSGGTHPLNKRRFFDFIIQAHNENSLLDETELNGILVDDAWSSDHALELSCKYRFGRDLLSYYGAH